MISRTGHRLIVLLVLAAGFSVASIPANAQAVPATEKQSAEDPDTPAMEADSAEAAEDPDIKDLELDWSQLNVDASTLLSESPRSKARLAPLTGPSTEMTWSSHDKSNGAAVSVKQPLSSLWDAHVGADMTVVRQPQTMSEMLADKAANGGNDPQSSGSAWAGITTPGVGAIWDKTAVEARVDPSQDQSKLGTSLSKSVALNERYSVTLQNGYSVIQQGIVPVPGIIPHPSRNYETDQSAKLTNADTGTSFSAGATLSSGDDRWLRKIGAEQKLFGGVNISGSIGETPFGTTNKSLTAGFKQSW
jgi:hypothetical protein